MKHSESKLQQHCVRWFRNIYPQYAQLLFSVPNGGLRGKTEAAIMKGEGLTKGVADLLLLLPSKSFHALAIELKKQNYDYKNGHEVITKTYQSKEQKEWQRAIENAGYKYAIIRTFDEFESLIDGYIEE